MDFLKRLTRTRAAQELSGYLIARYLRLVRRTNRFVMEFAKAEKSMEFLHIYEMGFAEQVPVLAYRHNWSS